VIDMLLNSQVKVSHQHKRLGVCLDHPQVPQRRSLLGLVCRRCMQADNVYTSLGWDPNLSCRTACCSSLTGQSTSIRTWYGWVLTIRKELIGLTNIILSNPLREPTHTPHSGLEDICPSLLPLAPGRHIVI
jgi:hypothetical protein